MFDHRHGPKLVLLHLFVNLRIDEIHAKYLTFHFFIPSLHQTDYPDYTDCLETTPLVWSEILSNHILFLNNKKITIFSPIE